MTSRQQRGLILLLGALAALGPFSVDTYLPGFRAIASDLNTDIASVSLSLTSYFIGISFGQLVYGPLLDRYGRKKPLLIGLVIYLLATLGCALAPDISSLIGLRLLQALGGCVGMVASRAIIRDHFPVHEIARVFSTLILVMGVAPILAPTIGGYLTEWLGWRSIFYMLALFAVILIFLLFYFLRESRGPHPEVSLKPRDIAVNYWKVLKVPEFWAYGTAGSLAMAGLFTYIAGSPFVFLELLGLEERAYGWLFGLNAAGFIAGSQVNRFVLKKKNSDRVTRLTAILALLAATGLLLTALYPAWFNLYSFGLLLFAFMFFLGFINPNTTAMALAPFEHNAGVASALIGSLRMVGGAVATGLMGALHNGTAAPMSGLMTILSAITLLLLLYMQKRESRPKTKNPSAA